MPTTRNTFFRGIMDKDTDERLVQQGVLRHAENVNISTSEGSNEGSVENILSNKQLTNLFFGANPETIGKFIDKAKNKLYWFIVSDSGCFIVEFDKNSGSAVKVLSDTRVVGERVLDLKRNYSITGIEKIVSEDNSKDLLLWTDNNLEPCCINIERAKNYPENGFSKEDIYLIKKPPFSAPTTQFILTDTPNNNIEEKFLLFAYRYKYLDGEYSALSSFSNYKFNPKPFLVDYDTLENLSMVNSYNAVRIGFNTGDKRVTDIQIVAKSSNSNNLYVVETFNKEKEDWLDNENKNFTYSDNKIYTLLPEKELYRLFDNVPRKAKALTVAGNRPILGNYVDGYNIVDNDLKKIKIDFEVFPIHYNLDIVEDLSASVTLDVVTLFGEPGTELKEGFKLIFSFYIIAISSDGITGVPYISTFEYILSKDYESLTELWADEDFQVFFVSISNNFQNLYEINIPTGANWDLSVPPTIILDTLLGYVRIKVTPAVYLDLDNENEPVLVNFKFEPSGTDVALSEIATATSLHSNRDYEAALIYIDPFGRQTIALTSANNTLHIPQVNSVTQNKIGLRINSKPPQWAVAYKVAVKAQPLTYQTIFVTKFYNQNVFVWCKLEGDNKDKVKEGDVLILKREATAPRLNVVKVKVLEIKTHEEDFIVDNVDELGNDLKEEAGTYMKIKPIGFTMSHDDFKVYEDSISTSTRAIPYSEYPIGILDLFTTINEEEESYSDLEVPEGSSIYLYIKSSRDFDSGWRDNIYEMTHFAQRDYDNLEEWFEEIILDRTLFGNKGTHPDNYEGNLEVYRDNNDKLKLKVTGTYWRGSGGRAGYLTAKIIVRTSLGVFVFETEPRKETELDVYYQSEETYWIQGGNHKAVTTNNPISATSENDQDVIAFKPAELELSFFNCYAFGNGVESFRVKDAFNSNFLNIDTKPTTTSVEEYKEIRRYADVTYGEPYIESSNINGLNEFNASLANWKELDKQDGEIQILYAREGDILVIQKNKWKRVLFGKDILFNADGTSNMSKIPQVLGQEIPYEGEYGMTDPESFAVEGNRCYGVDKDRGVVLRLSLNGLSTIVYGMKDWFRDIFHQNNRAKVIGGIDPYHKLYQITIGDQPVQLLELQCGNIINKFNQKNAFSYNFKLNNLGGDVTISYNITSGNADVKAVFDGQTYTASNVTGSGNLTFERTSLIENTVVVTITPVSAAISYEVANLCPIGSELKIVSIILNDEDDLGLTMTNRFRWGGSGFYEVNDLFDEVPCSRFEVETGLEGVGKFPLQGSAVNMQTIKDMSSTGQFKISDCNKLAYLITDVVYDEDDIDTILENANFLTLSNIGGEGLNEINQGSFIFSRTSPDEILYLIWDYTNRNPIVQDDSANCQVGQSVTIDVLSNDEVESGATINIIEGPQHGTYTINENQTITYTHDGTDNFEDSFVYQVNQGGCLSSATVTINIGIPCGTSFSGSGGVGIYKATINFGTEVGYCGIDFTVASIPDRFQLFYNGELVADSKFTGLLNDYPVTEGEYTLDVYNYDPSYPSGFPPTTDEQETIVITSDDIAPVSGITGGILYFEKTTPLPTTIELVVTGHPSHGTGWLVREIICPQEEIPT